MKHSANEPMSPATANLARAWERDREWQIAWFQIIMIVIVCVVAAILLFWATVLLRAPVSAPAPVPAQKLIETVQEGMIVVWDGPGPMPPEVREKIWPTTETAKTRSMDFIMPTPAAGLPAPLDRRKPRRIDPPIEVMDGGKP